MVNQMAKEIKPCPFCKGTKIKYSSKTMGANHWKKKVQYHIAMYCNSCHCYGPRTIITLNEGEHRTTIESDKYVQMAIDRWNER